MISYTESPSHLYSEATSGGAGPCVLFLHGMLSSRFQWRPNLEALNGYARPVLVELWGHGRSPTPLHDEEYNVEAYVSELERIRDLMGVPSLVVVGQSFGAALAMHYAIRYPERVDALVITNSVSAFAGRQTTQSRATKFRTALEIELGGVPTIRQLPMHPRNARRIPQELRELLVAAADAVDPNAVAQTMRITAAQASVRGKLHLIRCPVLLVNGFYEKSFQPFREVALTEIGQCDVVDLPAGHAVNIEAPDAFNDAVIDFLARVGRRKGTTV